MNKKLIIFAIVGLLWCFALVVLLYQQSQTINFVTLPLSLEKRKEPAKPVSILAFGDMMLDRAVRAQIITNGQEYPFAKIKDFLKGHDIVVVNAEGPFTNLESTTMGKKDAQLNFTFDPAMLPILKNLGFNVLSQANNHALNFGTERYQESIAHIEAADLKWFGDPSNIIVDPYIAEIRGEKIAFIGYHEFVYKGLENVLQAIRDVRDDVSFVIVYPHWGEEYNLGFTEDQQETAHAFIDAGADVVLGAHPHVIEPIEIYNGKVIFYSLGNFIFDQAANAPTGRGLAVKIFLEKDFVVYELFPFTIAKAQADLMSPDDRQAELDRLHVQTGSLVVPRTDVK